MKIDERPNGPYLPTMQKRTQKMGRPRGALFKRVKLPQNPERLSDINALNLAIQLTMDVDGTTPISDKAFAETVLRCDSRTIRKYREGRALPKLARSVCDEIVRQNLK